MTIRRLGKLVEGDRILVGGDGFATVPASLADAFQPGDSLIVPPDSDQILHLPAHEVDLARSAVDQAVDAFSVLAGCPDGAIVAFFEEFAGRLADPAIWRRIQQVNEADVDSASRRGRSTTRLIADERLRENMILGLEGWMKSESRRDHVLERVPRDGFDVELVGAPLGVVAFIFEGRPNVLADACGVIRGGNSVVFRIGSDALATARSLMELALRPSLEAAGLPAGSAVLLESPSHASGWALFSDRRLGLAVARGSGPTVEMLGSLARSVGVPVSLHGSGGAWLMTSASTRGEVLSSVVARSLDRKVCNTLNTVCIARSEQSRLVPALLEGLKSASQRLSEEFRIHIVTGSDEGVPTELFDRRVEVARAGGRIDEPQADRIPLDQLATEWEWEGSPEVSLVIVDDLDEAIALFNRYSPHFVACLLSESQGEHEQFWKGIDAPFVGDDHTRWVDGQFALGRPELGLSNWQHGRLFGRGGVLSGDSVFSVRTRFRKHSV